MNALLIIPKPDVHGHLTPLGPLYVAAVLRQNNINVNVLDLNSQPNRLHDVLVNHAPKYCIISTSFRFYGNCPPITLSSAIKIAGTIKQTIHNVKTILIGPISSVMADSLILKEEVDFVVVGEPDFVVSELILSLENNQDISTVRGLIYAKNNVIIKTEISEYPDVNKLPFPARDLIDTNKYVFDSYFSERVLSILTSRGCPFGCTFCFISHKGKLVKCNKGRFYRGVDPEKVIHEIELIENSYAIKGLKFEDPEFCVDKDRVRRICNLMIEKKKTLKWKCQSRVVQMSSDLLHLMKKAGCESIYYGVESGVQDILDRTDKNILLDQIKETFHYTRDAGIKADASFLFGLPGDNWDTVRKTVQFAKEIKPNIATFHVYTPFPGSYLTNEKGFFNVDSSNTYKAKNYSVCDMSPKELKRATQYAYRSFYLRPSYIANVFIDMLKNPYLFRYIFSGKQEGKLSKELITNSIDVLKLKQRQS